MTRSSAWATARWSMLAVVAIALAGAPSDARACCMAPRLEHHLLTPAEVAIPPDGALVIGVRNAWGPASTPTLPARVTALTVALAGGATIRARLVPIAPGLARLVPPSPWPAGTHALPELRTTFRVAPAGAPSASGPPPPAAQTLVREESTARWTTLVSVSARLAQAIPPGVVAVIVTPARAGASSIAWAQATTGNLTPPVAPSPGRCGALPEGFSLPERGERYTLAYVDAAGRISPPSAPVRVE